MTPEICACLAFCFQCQTLTRRDEQLLSPEAATPVDDLIWAGCRLAAEEGTGHCVPCRVGTLRAQISFIRVDNTLFCPYTCIHIFGREENGQCKRLIFLDCSCCFLVVLRNMGMTSNLNTCRVFANITSR